MIYKRTWVKCDSCGARMRLHDAAQPYLPGQPRHKPGYKWLRLQCRLLSEGRGDIRYTCTPACAAKELRDMAANILENNKS